MSKTRLKPLLRPVVDGAIVLALAVVVLYASLILIKVNRGYSKTQPTPEYIVRLQIVHSPEQAALANQVAARLEASSDELFDIKVVEKVAFDKSTLPHSFIIARENDPAVGRKLAEHVGLKPDEVISKPLENNRLHVTATIVLGDDAPTLLIDESQGKEKQGKA